MCVYANVVRFLFCGSSIFLFSYIHSFIHRVGSVAVVVVGVAAEVGVVAKIGIGCEGKNRVVHQGLALLLSEGNTYLTHAEIPTVQVPLLHHVS